MSTRPKTKLVFHRFVQRDYVRYGDVRVMPSGKTKSKAEVHIGILIPLASVKVRGESVEALKVRCVKAAEEHLAQARLG